MFAVYLDICDVVLEYGGNVDLVSAVLASSASADGVVLVFLEVNLEEIDKWRVIRLQCSRNGYDEGDRLQEMCPLRTR